MGVDFYGCKCCGESKYSEHVGSCQNCGKSLCTSCLINDNINSSWAHEYGMHFEEDKLEEIMKELSMIKEDFYDVTGKPYWSEGTIIDDTSILEKYCPFCSGDKINKETLFDYLVEKLDIDVERAWEDYKKQR